MTDTSMAVFDSRLQHATARDTGFHDDDSPTVGGDDVFVKRRRSDRSDGLPIGVTHRSQGARGDHAWRYDSVVLDQDEPPVISCDTHDIVPTTGVFENPTWQQPRAHTGQGPRPISVDMDIGGSTEHMRLHLPRSHVAHRAEDGSASSDDSSKLRRSERKLQKEIAKIENEIKLLSAKRSRKVRSDIATLLSGDETGKRSDSSSIQSPRSANNGMGEVGKVGKTHNLLTRVNTTAANVGPKLVPGKSKPDAKVNVEAVRTPGSPAALNSVVVGDCAQGISGNDSQGRNVAEPRTILRKQLKLEKYDGLSVPLETFVAKYKNCAKFNKWTDEECAVFLRDSLTGNASQLLWELKQDASADEVIKLLRNRFGNANQMERYRAELNNRRRARGESIQAVYQDIRRLLALAFPGETGDMYEVLGRDAFLNALADPALRVRVLDQNPKTLDDTLSILVRMDAYSNPSPPEDDGTERKRVRVVSPARETAADRRIKNLEECIERQNQEIKQLKQASSRRNFASSRRNGGGPTGVPPRGPPNMQRQNDNYGHYNGCAPAPYVPTPLVNSAVLTGAPTENGFVNQQYGPPTVGPMWQQQQLGSGRPASMANGQSSGRGNYRRRAYNRLPRNVCARCGGQGHWKNECPAVGYSFQSDSGYPVGSNNESQGPPPDTDMYGANHIQLMSDDNRSEVYIDVKVRGRTLPALLDSGCEKSICALRLCKNARITPVRTELYAANSTPISVVGTTRLFFEVCGIPTYADVYVSDEIDEFILGFDFLLRCRCQWLFAQRRIVINGHSVPLHCRPSRGAVRRVFVSEPVVIPADTSMNVPVKLPFLSMHAPVSDWATPPIQVKPGLLAARTLLSHKQEHSAVAVMNISGVDQALRSGCTMGTATPCPSDSVHPFNGVVSINSVPMPEGGRDEAAEPDAESASAASVSSYGDETVVKCASVHVSRGGSPEAESPAADDYAHVQPVIDTLPSSLTDDQREQAIALIKSNADIFGKHEFDVGLTDLITARVITGDHEPIAEPLRRHARAHLDVIDDTVEKMMKAGIVERAASPWSANLVIISRKDDSGRPITPRVTIDFRKLNAITYKDRYPIPNLKECLQSLDKCTFVSIFDLSNSFYQVGIDAADRDKVAFCTRRGQFRLKRMAQGLTNSPSQFCRLMAMVLQGLDCCLAYIDDTICHSPTFEDHLADLDAVFDRFRKANLKLKATKCKLFQTSCKFVGHIVSGAGIAVDPQKIACIVNWPFPKTLTELRAFIGLASYYRSFCQSFASIASPLTECLRKGVILEWTEKRQEAFDRLKTMLTSASLLAFPRDDPECTYVVDTDASGTGAGGICQQWQDGKLRVIEYASRTFNKAERAYCATRREMAALIFALKQFRPYLLGRRFQIRVDNQALSFYQTLKDATGQTARYLDFLSNFDFEIIHRNSSSHANVDSISRLPPCAVENGEPCAQCEKRVIGRHAVYAVQTRAQRRQSDDKLTGPATDDQATEVAADTGHDRPIQNVDNGGYRKRRRRNKQRREPALQTIAPTAWEAATIGWTPDILRDMQLKDNDIGPAILWVERNAKPPWSDVQSQSPMLRALWQQFDSLVLLNGVLYRLFYDHRGLVLCYQLILPGEIKVPFLELVHNDAAGHLKFAKCLQHVVRRAWWWDWKKDLRMFIRCCSKCESFHRGRPPRQTKLNHTYSGYPGEKYGIDLQGPFPSSNGYRYIFSALCCFSKYAIVVPLRNKEASTVAKAIVENIFLKYGLCTEILTDRGQEFQADLLSELLKILGVTRLKTSGYRPESNGACEVLHRTLNSLMAKVVNENQRNWSEWLSFITFAYNATEHSATRFSPFFVFFGRTPLWTVDLILPETVEDRKSLPDYTAQVVERLKKACETVRINLKAAADSSSKWYNKRVIPRSFAEGDLVRVFYPRRYAGKTAKWQNFYRTVGQVVKKLNDATYLVKSKSWKEPKIIHTDKLRPILQFE